MRAESLQFCSLPHATDETTINNMNVPNNVVLIVEDVPHILELLEITLRFKGYTVITARNGQEALELARRQPPDLVITDILMPKMDGFALAYHLRSDLRLSRIPIIFLSATYVTPEDRDFALRLGAVRFIEKPVDTEAFLLTVADVLAGEARADLKPMNEEDFYQGYRERLEVKLRQKNAQIARSQRLLETLPEDQKATFRLIHAEAVSQREAVQRELEELYKILNAKT